MTLTERVDAARKGSSDAGSGTKLTVGDLRQDVKDLTSLDALAAMLATDPESAKAELRMACRRALATAKWAGLTPEDRSRMTESLVDVVFGMGPVEALIEDDAVTEVMVNGAGEVFYEMDGRLIKSQAQFESDEQVRVLIDRIIGPLGRRIDESSPMVNARLPQGHRVNAVIPPITPDGPHLTIRAFGKRSPTLGEMAQAGSVSTSVAKHLGWLVRMRKNVVVSGGTGSGKTTMLNALSRLIDPSERVITIEDSAELKLPRTSHVVRMEARPKNAEGTGEVSIRDLVINSLRMRPDRIIVGECRSSEAWDMLQAMNTGHSGSMTTLHANSPEDVVDRMVTMVRYAADLPVDAIEAQIGSAFDAIVQISRDKGGGRYVSEIADVGFSRESRRATVTPVFKRSSFADPGRWCGRPALLEELHAAAVDDEALEEEVRQWEQQAL